MVEVTGTAAIGGDLVLEFVGDRPSEDTSYTVLAASSGVSGEFDGCTGCGPGDTVTYQADARRLTDGARAVTVTVRGSNTPQVNKMGNAEM